jgi:hypothetical protein
VRALRTLRRGKLRIVHLSIVGNHTVEADDNTASHGTGPDGTHDEA